MADPHRSIERNAIRRRDREVADDRWIEALLYRAPVGVLATADGPLPDVNANLFVYAPGERALYLHTARVGRTRDVIAANPRVAFTVWEMGRLLPADTALEFSVEFASVVAYGDCTVVEDEALATRALSALLVKYAPHLEAGSDYRPPVPAELKRTTVLRVEIDRWGGKRKVAEPDFPGAFVYGVPDGSR